MARAPESDPDARYEVNSRRSELFGYLLLGGLGVELIFAIFLNKPWIEWASTLLADGMIVVGVWGEIHFGRRAREAGDAAQTLAKVRIAEAERETARLRRQMAPRFLGPQFTEALKSAPPASAAILYLKDAQDTFELGGWTVAGLSSAGWRILDCKPIEPSDDPVLRHLPSIIAAHGHLTGVTIVAPFEVPGLGMATLNGLLKSEWVGQMQSVSPQLAALVVAFFGSLNHVSIGRPNPSLPDGTFNIVIGPKP